MSNTFTIIDIMHVVLGELHRTQVLNMINFLIDIVNKIFLPFELRGSGCIRSP